MNLEKPPHFPVVNKRIWIAGHAGLVGSALFRRLSQENCTILTASRGTLDLTDQRAVHTWIKNNKPDGVIIAAAKVGGIMANATQPAAFLYENLMIQTNIIHAAYEADVKRLLALGSSCIYPRDAQNPLTEDMLLTGALEQSNEPYAVAKIAGIKLCETYRTQYGCDFISALPCNLYGVNDRFDAQNSHVIPALMMRAHDAKMKNAPTLEIWGSGTPRREFMEVDDLADALIHVFQHYTDTAPINIGYGADITIKELSSMICDVVGYMGDLTFNTDKPDGTAQKLMDNTKLKNLGWSPQIDLKTGLNKMYAWYMQQINDLDVAL